jgi:hypothetical protein
MIQNESNAYMKRRVITYSIALLCFVAGFGGMVYGGSWRDELVMKTYSPSTQVPFSPAIRRSTLAFPGADGRLVYHPFSDRGDVIPDFSGVGYRGGAVALPTVPVRITIDPSEEDIDDTDRIQNAINQVSAMPPDENGFRGAVLLRRGRYRVGNGLVIEASGVVLRGEGSHTGGTVLYADAPKQYNVVTVGTTAASRVEVAGTRQAVTDQYVPVGSRTLTLSNATAFTVGDRVVVERTPTQKWIDTLGMGPNGRMVLDGGTAWTPAGYTIGYEREITAVNGNTIMLDIPVVQSLDQDFGGGFVYRYTFPERIQEVGVEHMRFESYFQPGAQNSDNNHARNAVVMRAVEHGWVRNVGTIWFSYSAVNIEGLSAHISVIDCAYLDGASSIEGGQRYAFNISGQKNLVRNCYASRARHSFVLGSRVPGPNVFSHCRADRAISVSEGHHRWSTGVLYDNIEHYEEDLFAVNRGNSGTGHGWSSAHVFFWNCVSALIVVQKPPTAQNFAIGLGGPPEHRSSQGNIDWVNGQSGEGITADFTTPAHGSGFIEHPHNPVEPRSLYEHQLRERLNLNQTIAWAYAEGGTITNIVDASGIVWRTHIFAESGELHVTRQGNVELLIVGGGGGGGCDQFSSARSAGGGGAGGILFTNATIDAGSVAVVVGAGGAGGTGMHASTIRGQQGEDSSFNGHTAIGGGGGAGHLAVSNDGFTQPPTTGGSGGGANHTGTGASGTTGQGNRGGNGFSATSNWHGGGGGGAGGSGRNAVSGSAGAGGAGRSFSAYFGTGVGANGRFAGGGGGVGMGAGAAGGSGGGGTGQGTAGGTANGMANTGSGGGARRDVTSSGSGGDGGSGIVIVRYREMATVPFGEDFEDTDLGMLHSQNNWLAQGVVVQTDVVWATGSRAAQIIEGYGYMHQVFPGRETRVWTDVVMQPVLFGDDPPPNPGATVLLYFNKDGYPVVYDGPVPTVLTGLTPVAAGEWVRVTIKSDYVSRKWDLYLNSHLVASELAFYDQDAIGYMSFLLAGAGESSAYVDDIQIVLQRPWGDVVVTENYAVPHDWLRSFYPELTTPEEFEAAALAVDANGVPNWQKYWTGMNPLNPDSVLRIRQVVLQNGQFALRWEHDAASPDLPPIAIQMRTNLLTGAWEPIGQFVPLNGENAWTNTTLLPNAFYRFAVTNAPAGP